MEKQARQYKRRFRGHEIELIDGVYIVTLDGVEVHREKGRDEAFKWVSDKVNSLRIAKAKVAARDERDLEIINELEDLSVEIDGKSKVLRELIFGGPRIDDRKAKIVASAKADLDVLQDRAVKLQGEFVRIIAEDAERQNLATQRVQTARQEAAMARAKEMAAQQANPQSSTKPTTPEEGTKP